MFLKNNFPTFSAETINKNKETLKKILRKTFGTPFFVII